MKTTLSFLATATYACVFLITPAKVHADPVDYFAGFGSFESDGSNTTLQFNQSNSSTSIPGWIVRRIGDFPLSSTPIWLNDDQAQDGEHYLLLKAAGGSSPSRSSARFDFSLSPVALTPGELYELSFWAAGADNSYFDYNLLSVMLLSGTRMDVDNPFTPFLIPAANQTDVLDWMPYTLVFMSTSPNESITIGPPMGSWSNVYLDNFSLRQIPEPGSVVLLGAAAGLLGLRRRRSSQLCAGRRTP